MTDKELKEKILAEIERLEEENNTNPNVYDFGCERAFERIKDFINSIPEEHVSKKLEEAVNKYTDNTSNFLEYSDDNWTDKNDIEYVEKAFKAGVQWQKEQMERNRREHCINLTNEQAELEQGFLDQHLDKYQRMPTFLDAIEYGMKIAKEIFPKSSQRFLMGIDLSSGPDCSATTKWDGDKIVKQEINLNDKLKGEEKDER